MQTKQYPFWTYHRHVALTFAVIAYPVQRLERSTFHFSIHDVRKKDPVMQIGSLVLVLNLEKSIIEYSETWITSSERYLTGQWHFYHTFYTLTDVSKLLPHIPTMPDDLSWKETSSQNPHLLGSFFVIFLVVSKASKCFASWLLQVRPQ